MPPDVMEVLTDDSVFWAGRTADVCGVAVGADGLAALRRDAVEGLSMEGGVLWTVPLPAPPVRWGVALTAKTCVVTLADGRVVCLGVSGREP